MNTQKPQTGGKLLNCTLGNMNHCKTSNAACLHLPDYNNQNAIKFSSAAWRKKKILSSHTGHIAFFGNVRQPCQDIGDVYKTFYKISFFFFCFTFKKNLFLVLDF